MAYKPHQVSALLKEFGISRYITTHRMRELGNELGLTPKQIKVWFQNRRMKEKREKDVATSEEPLPDSSIISEHAGEIQQIEISDIDPEKILAEGGFVDDVMSLDMMSSGNPDFFF